MRQSGLLHRFFLFEETLAPIEVYRIFLFSLEFSPYISLLDIHNEVLLPESVSLRDHFHNCMQRNLDIWNLLDLYPEEITRNASQDGLVSKYDNWTFLSLNPVNQRFQSSNHIQIGFSAWISESQFVDVSSFRNFWVFVFDITIGHFFTNTSIQFVKYPKLYFAYFVEFEFFGCLYCSLEGTCQYNS